MQESYTIFEIAKNIIPFVGTIISGLCTIIIPIILYRVTKSGNAEKAVWKRIDDQRRDIEKIDARLARLEGKLEIFYKEHERLGGECGKR
jgi:hypothetical protein